MASRRSPESALGRETRGLLGPSRASGDGSRLPSLGLRGGRPGSKRGGRLRKLTRPRIAAIVSPARAAGLLGMLASGFLLTFVTGPSAFGLSRTDVPELRWTSSEAIRAALALEPGSNVFRLDTEQLDTALEALPAVAGADVRVALPDAAVVVNVQEREAILAWEVGDDRFLADRHGVLFASISREAELPAGAALVQDRRLGAAGRYVVGDRLDDVDLDVATRLGSLTPADVGSAAPSLHVRVTDTDGFFVFIDRGWQAVFGFYSPTTRPTGIIAGQVRLLRSLLVGREEAVARIILASETVGTYVPEATPKPSKK